MSTYFINTYTNQYWNEEKKVWVNTIQEATDLGHKKLTSKPKDCVRARIEK